MHIIYDQKSFIFFHSQCPIPILLSERTNESKFYQNHLLQYVISESYSCYWNRKLIALASLATRENVKVETSSSYNMFIFKNVSLSCGNFLTISLLQMAQNGMNWVFFLLGLHMPEQFIISQHIEAGFHLNLQLVWTNPVRRKKIAHGNCDWLISVQYELKTCWQKF